MSAVDTVARGLAAEARGAVRRREASGPRGASPLPLAQQLRSTAAMLARVRAGTGSGTIALLGDSTSFGTGASGRTQDYAHRLAAILSAAGVPAETDGVYGLHGFSAGGLASYDNRLTMGAGWTGNTMSIAGTMFSNTADTSAMTFTPERQVNAFDLLYPTDPQFGTVGISIDGGAPQSVSLQQRYGTWAWNGTVWAQTVGAAAAAATFGRATFLCPTGTHTISIARASGNVKISGVRGYRTELRQVHIANWGRPGETAGGWAAGNSYWNLRSANGFQVILKPDLTLIDLGINDVNTSVPADSYAANLQNVVTGALLSTRDVALVVPVPSWDAGNLAMSKQLAMRARLEEVAAANTLPIIADMPARWGEYAGGSGLGFYGAAADGIHPWDTGYADKAQAIARVLLSL